MRCAGKWRDEVQEGRRVRISIQLKNPSPSCSSQSNPPRLPFPLFPYAPLNALPTRTATALRLTSIPACKTHVVTQQLDGLFQGCVAVDGDNVLLRVKAELRERLGGERLDLVLRINKLLDDGALRDDVGEIARVANDGQPVKSKPADDQHDVEHGALSEGKPGG